MCLGGDDDVPESTIQKMLDEALGRERKLLGLRQTVTRGQRILERAGVDTDAYGDAGLACRLDDGIDLAHRSDIARIDAQARRMLMACPHRNLVVEVYVGNDGQRALQRNLAEARDRGAIGDGNAHDLAPCLGQASDLRKIAFNI